MRNKMIQTLISLWAGAALLTGCGPVAVEEPLTKCLKVTEAEGSSLVTSAPARVALLFGVDTCSGDPVSGLDAASFSVSEDDRPVSEFESSKVVRPKGQRYRMNSIVLLDMSGSTLRSGQFPDLKEAASKYVRTVLASREEGQRVAIMTFDGRVAPTTVVDFTDSLDVALAGLDSLERRECTTSTECAGFSDRRTCAAWRCIDDSTNLYGAVVGSLDVLESRDQADSTITWKDSALVIFTDGTDQASRVSNAEALKRTSQTKAHVFTVGLGGEVDELGLRAFGKDGYFPAARSSELTQAFEGVATRVTGLANRFYLLEYCSPKRGGQHTLKVTVTKTLADGTQLKGGLSREFDATGFASGCSVQ